MQPVSCLSAQESWSGNELSRQDPETLTPGQLAPLVPEHVLESRVPSIAISLVPRFATQEAQRRPWIIARILIVAVSLRARKLLPCYASTLLGLDKPRVSDLDHGISSAYPCFGSALETLPQGSSYEAPSTSVNYVPIHLLLTLSTRWKTKLLLCLFRSAQVLSTLYDLSPDISPVSIRSALRFRATWLRSRSLSMFANRISQKKANRCLLRFVHVAIIPH